MPKFCVGDRVVQIKGVDKGEYATVHRVYIDGCPYVTYDNAEPQRHQAASSPWPKYYFEVVAEESAIPEDWS